MNIFTKGTSPWGLYDRFKEWQMMKSFNPQPGTNNDIFVIIRYLSIFCCFTKCEMMIFEIGEQKWNQNLA
ncbi:MAG: hypothetical protein LBU74_01060 [Methanobacteriaceae archaeon]|nr:hypothetical protein [Candidatus Methanorudis spinitermitis]